jgi:hypothetical protein
MSVADNPTAEQCQYCGLQIARSVEKYLGIIPYKINTDDKYLDGVEKIKNIVLETSQNPITANPKCAPQHRKSVPEGFSLPYIYVNPIPPKYNTGEPGFGIISPDKTKISCFSQNKNGSGRRRRKKTRKKRRRRRKRTKKKRRKRR